MVLYACWKPRERGQGRLTMESELLFTSSRQSLQLSFKLGGKTEEIYYSSVIYAMGIKDFSAKLHKNVTDELIQNLLFHV